MHTLTFIFLLAVGLTTTLRAWLALRQIRAVTAHRETVPQEFAATIPLDAHIKAADYTVARVRLGLADLALGTLFLLWLTLGGGMQAVFQAWTPHLVPGGYGHGVAFLASLAVLGFLVDLPFALYRTFVVEERFGFNKMTLRLWLVDLVKETLLGAAIGLPVLFAVLWLMARMGEFWWLWVWAFWLGFNLLVLLIYPTFIAPLFNKFTPLTDEALAQRIGALLQRCGFTVSGLFVMDGSRRSAHGNAYFTGFGSAKRIVFFDTLLERLSPPEVEAVLAHELGHYKHRHIWQRVAMLAAISLCLLAGLGYLIGQPWFFQGLGMSAQGTAPALALFSLAIPVFSFPFSPFMSQVSRCHEFQADAYAASQTRATDLVSALAKLYRDNASTLTPDPLYSNFHDSHPPAAIRIARLLDRS
ncbi:MAG: M48 family metallopeptidase [Rhodocyclaceae bacterium]|nr:M48 family metallopeptidase [Rhodocyclaceae bacterium]